MRPLAPALAALALLAGCGDDDTGPATSTPATPEGGVAATTVEIASFAFAPNETNVRIGQKVEWVNEDSAAHNVVENDGAFESETLEQGDTFAYTTEKAGTFNYICTFHPQMKATLIVE